MTKRTRRIRPDMTPLIDCVFLLLVFFLVTSVFKQDESVLKLILPETQSEVKRDTPEGPRYFTGAKTVQHPAN